MIENVLRWRFVEKRGLGEGMEELTTVALELHSFLTPHGDDTMPKLHAVFRRPTIRIITFVLRASQRRKTHQTHFTLTLSGLLEMIQSSEAKGLDTGYKVETTQETRALALLLLLHNSPPAVCTFKVSSFLCWFFCSSCLFPCLLLVVFFLFSFHVLLTQPTSWLRFSC